MAPRAYDNHTRQQQQAALRRRIEAAAAELHAAQGVLATSHAQVAQRAGVSVPTVYKHYPDIDQLVRGCTGHVMGRAPAVPAQAILAAPTLCQAVRELVDAMDRVHAYYEPWRVWGEQGRVPALAEIALSGQRQITQLCAAVLAQHRVPGERRELVATWESLLHFGLWHRLVRLHGLSRAAVRRRLVHLLLAGVGPRPAAFTHSRPVRRKSA
jgi:AcrR family transcriptional regulator